MTRIREKASDPMTLAKITRLRRMIGSTKSFSGPANYSRPKPNSRRMNGAIIWL